MNFNKNDLMDAVNSRFFESFCCTLDVADHVPERYLVEVEGYIFKNMRKAWKKIDREDKRYQKELKRKERHAQTQEPDQQQEQKEHHDQTQTQ